MACHHKNVLGAPSKPKQKLINKRRNLITKMFQYVYIHACFANTCGLKDFQPIEGHNSVGHRTTAPEHKEEHSRAEHAGICLICSAVAPSSRNGKDACLLSL